MSEHPTAAFADQITPGMVIDPHPRPSGMDHLLGPAPAPDLVTVTGVRRALSDPDPLGVRAAVGARTGEPMTVVYLIGHYADGRPYHGCMGAHCAVHVHGVPVPDTAEGAARDV